MERRCKRCRTLRDLTWFPTREARGPVQVCFQCLGRPKPKDEYAPRKARPARKRYRPPGRALAKTRRARRKVIAARAAAVRVDPERARALRTSLTRGEA